MGTIQNASPNAEWRKRLVAAYYNNVRFHVEQQARNSGRRVVLHEYPKRDDPYAEDMGRHARRYQMNGYIIGPSYHLQKQALIHALEDSEGGMLMDPYLAQPMMAICERYSVTETRERGGFCVFDMVFVEVGQPGNNVAGSNTSGVLQNAASNGGQVQAITLNNAAPSPLPPLPFPSFSGFNIGSLSNLANFAATIRSRFRAV
jgi:prophage DNA circulation protein